MPCDYHEFVTYVLVTYDLALCLRLQRNAGTAVPLRLNRITHKNRPRELLVMNTGVPISLKASAITLMVVVVQSLNTPGIEVLILVQAVLALTTIRQGRHVVNQTKAASNLMLYNNL